MNEEIKEILHKLNNKAEHYILYDYEVKVLLDYMTNLQQNYNDNVNKYEDLIVKYSNLQQELKEANDSITWWTNRFSAVMRENKQLKNNRDKAIEYIEWQRDNPQYDNVWRKYECESLINILKGDSDE